MKNKATDGTRLIGTEHRAADSNRPTEIERFDIFRYTNVI